MEDPPSSPRSGALQVTSYQLPQRQRTDMPSTVTLFAQHEPPLPSIPSSCLLLREGLAELVLLEAPHLCEVCSTMASGGVIASGALQLSNSRQRITA